MMDNVTYKERLKDPRWQKKKNHILELDGYTCQYCGAKDKPLHVHHTFYTEGKAPWEYLDEDLVTLCEDCHGKVHTGEISENELGWCMVAAISHRNLRVEEETFLKEHGYPLDWDIGSGIDEDCELHRKLAKRRILQFLWRHREELERSENGIYIPCLVTINMRYMKFVVLYNDPIITMEYSVFQDMPNWGDFTDKEKKSISEMLYSEEGIKLEFKPIEGILLCNLYGY